MTNEESEKEAKEIEKAAEKAAEKVAKEASEKAEEAVGEIKKAAEEVSEEIEKTGKDVAEEIKKAGKETEKFKVEKGASVVGKTVEEIDDLGLLGKDALLVEIKRGDETITPKGVTPIKAEDIVTVTSSGGIVDKTREAFKRKS